MIYVLDIHGMWWLVDDSPETRDFVLDAIDLGMEPSLQLVA